MAIVFELVVNFGAEETAAAAAAELVRRAGPINVRGVPVPLGEPFVGGPNRWRSHIEFSVHPRGIGYGGPGPKPDIDPGSLTPDDLSGIARTLYDLLKEFHGYRAAIVGWDPESLVDLDDLESDWREGDPPSYEGLVLANDLCDRWRLGPEWIAFDSGHRWLPDSAFSDRRTPGDPVGGPGGPDAQRGSGGGPGGQA